MGVDVNLLALKMKRFPTFAIIWFSALFTLSRLSSLVGVRERDLCPLSPAPLRCQHRHPSQPTPHNTLIGKNTFHSAIFSPSPLTTQDHLVKYHPPTTIYVACCVLAMFDCLLASLPPVDFYQDQQKLGLKPHSTLALIDLLSAPKGALFLGTPGFKKAGLFLWNL